ncbi:helix-turn-helix domain-containing protein [Streptomyces eurythermus]|uniref:helix-turn-helix domain-containing protein n=1 Tax=Streptomyces eurythermus TaxID=42237 RepID=UPI0033D2BEE7
MKMLGRQLAAARRAKGLSQPGLAAALNIHEETVASIEQGRRVLKLDMAELFDEFLETKGMLAAGVANLPEVDQFPLWAEEYIEQEREAIVLSFYANQVLPGLLQTEAYARAVLHEHVPAYDEDELETKLTGRIGRQELFRRKSPPTVSFVIWEPVLHLAVGGPDIQTDQLQHLRRVAEHPHVSMQFLSLASDAHAGLDGPFVLLETSDHQHLAYTESQRGSQWVSNPDEVSILARQYAMLRTQALTTQRSQDLLDSLLGEQ